MSPKDLQYYQELTLNISAELDGIKEDILTARRPDEVYDLQRELSACLEVYKDSCENMKRLLVSAKVVEFETYRQIKAMMKLHGV